MHLKDVLNKCKEENYPITASGLYYAGIKNGFLFKKEGSRNLDFNKEKFFEWLEKAKEEIPEGWVSVNQLHSILDISLAQAYILIKDPESNSKYIGAGKGVLYVDPERVKKIIEKRANQHKENWED